jgi:DnaK suppressor protein
MTLAARKLKKEHNTQFRALLQQKRDELIQRLYERRAELHGENDPDDEAGVAVQSVVEELALTNMEREIRTLAEVELSLRRLETGEYGICGGCERPIPEARLRALPWTRLCVECAGGGFRHDSQQQEERKSSNVATKSSSGLHIIPKRKISA